MGAEPMGLKGSEAPSNAMSWGTRAVAHVRLTRPGNVIGGGILAAVGAFVAAGPVVTIPIISAVAATALGTAAGNAINDYFDREIDAINRPDRPIPAGLVAPATAKWFSAVALAIAIGLTLVVLPTAAIAIAVINLFLLTAYTTVFKGTPGLGNGVVAFLVASAIWFGAAAGGDLLVTLEIGILAGVATFAREVVKDIEDIPGDRAQGLTTLPIAIGSTRAWMFAIATLVIGAALSPLPYLQETFGWWYFVGLIPAIAIMGYGTLIGRDRPAIGQQLLKAGMYVALVAFIAGRAQLAL